MSETLPILCRPVSLPDHLIVDAARLAVQINPANAPAFAALGEGIPIEPARLIALTSSFWRPGDTLTWNLVDGPTPGVIRQAELAFARIARCANLNFVRTTVDPICRIARTPGAGHWSYIGTGTRMVAPPAPTMNWDGFTDRTPEAEWLRVADHEILHFVGIMHGHLSRWIRGRLDPAGCYRFYGGPPNFWPRSLVDSQILATPPAGDLTDFGPEGIEVSVTTYPFPPECTLDRRGIAGGTRLTAKDCDDLGRIYGRPEVDPPDISEPDPPPDPVVVIPPPAPGNLLRWGHASRFTPKAGVVTGFRLPFLVRKRRINFLVVSPLAGSKVSASVLPAGGKAVEMQLSPGSSGRVWRGAEIVGPGRV